MVFQTPTSSIKPWESTFLNCTISEYSFSTPSVQVVAHLQNKNEVVQ